MKIKSVEIENFKGIKYLKIDNLSGVNIFIGKNNSCKSTILECLLYFFSGSVFNHLGNDGGLKTVAHRNSEGNKDVNTSISLTFNFEDFDLEGDETKDLGFITGSLKRRLLNTEISLSRNAFDEKSDPFKIFKLMQISNDTPINDDVLYKFAVRRIVNNFSWGRGLIFLSALDGMKRVSNLKEYFRHLEDGMLSNGGGARAGQRSYFSHIGSLLGGDERHKGRKKLSQLREFSPSEFSNFNVRSNNDIVVEFGPEENLTSIPFHNTGAGELEMIEYLQALDTIESNRKLIILDEPESHKHIALQRRLLNLFFEVVDSSTIGSQFFISTHSPTFASAYKKENCSVFVISRNLKDDTNHAKKVNVNNDVAHLKNEVGLVNADYFFADFILFVEGETEEKVVPAIFSKLDYDLEGSGIKLISVDSVDNVNLSRMKELLEIFKDTGIIPLVVLDNENNAERNREDILRPNSELFSIKEEISYKLWTRNFVDSLPADLVKRAFSDLLIEKKLPPVETTTYDKWFADGNIEKEFEKYIHKVGVGHKFDKVNFGERLATLIRDEDIFNSLNSKDNEVFSHFSQLIEHVKSLK